MLLSTLENVEETIEEVEETTPVEETEELVEGSKDQETKETTEEVEKEQSKEKLYTEEELEKIISRRVSRMKSKLEKEYAPYKETEGMLKAALKVDTIDEINSKVREGYQKEGIKVPDKIDYTSALDNQRLGIGDADDIIEEGYESMVEEADRLASKGGENLNPREKATFTKLVEEIRKTDDLKELSKLGVKPEVIEQKEFKDFRKKFSKDTSVKEVYELFTKTNTTKKQVEPIGSMKNKDANRVKKNYYSPEEVDKLTNADFERDPELYDRVSKSMTQWR